MNQSLGHNIGEVNLAFYPLALSRTPSTPPQAWAATSPMWGWAIPISPTSGWP